MENSVEKEELNNNEDEEKFKVVPKVKKNSWFDEVYLNPVEIFCTECLIMIPTRLSAITHFKMHLKPFCVICLCQMETMSDLVLHAENGHPAVAHLIKKPYSKHLKRGLSVLDHRFLEARPKVSFSKSGRTIRRPEID